MAETLADLLREAGIDYSGAATRLAEQTPYTPSTPLRRPTRPQPRQGDYARERQYRIEGARDRLLRGPDRLGAVGDLAADLTGAPALAQHMRARMAGDRQSAVTEGLTGLAQASGFVGLPGRSMRPLLGAARAPAEAAAVAHAAEAPRPRWQHDEFGDRYTITNGQRYYDDASQVTRAERQRLTNAFRPTPRTDPESPQRIPRAIQPQTRASDGTILPAQPRETFGRPFRRTEASSDDLREAAAMPPQLRGGTPEALQRAREQGFDVDTPLYHGTGRDFDEFRDNGGIWASSDPAEASGYAQRRSEIFQDGDPRVIPVFMRNAQNAGTHYYVTNPADIRSRFAAFDPARSGESDLLASSAAPRDAGEPFQWGRHSDIKPSADPALVDAHGARDYDRALAARGGAPQAIADDLRQQPRGWDTEHAAYEARNGVYPITSGGQVSARPGPVPYSARGRIYMHHTHPNHGVEDLPNPLSTTDIKWLTQRPAVRGIYAHEYMGGGSYAERGGRAGNRRAGEAIDRGEEAARKRLGDQSPLADHVTNRAARRHGVLRRYGYRPSNDDQAIMLDAAQKDMSRAEWDALRAMHGPIYGLPYPLSWGRIGAATGAGLAANAMLERRK